MRDLTKEEIAQKTNRQLEAEIDLYREVMRHTDATQRRQAARHIHLCLTELQKRETDDPS